MNDVFRGHVEECLRHLAARFLEAYPKGSRSSGEGKKPIAEFCRVNIHTITDWFFRSEHLPRGEQYITLLCFLDLNGYKVIELERMAHKCKNFAKLIGFGLIKSEDAAEMLGYTQVSELFQVLRGERGISLDKEEKLWDLWKVRKDELDQAVEEASVKYRLSLGLLRQQALPGGTAAKAAGPKTNGCPIDGSVDIMRGLLKLFESGAFENLSDADCAYLRESSSAILGLSSHLSTLSAKLLKPR